MWPEPEHRIGEVFESKYQIEELLGTGAMGSVFRARHVAIGRRVAVKLLHPRFLEDKKLMRRFEREAELAGKLRHPNVVSVVDVGTHEGVSFLVMDLADGVPLNALLAQAPFAPPRARRLIRELCDGLEHAHEHGLIHRDLKPDNIIIDPHGTARIVDFGIALLRETTGSDERLTTGGVVLGTPHYMAPELAMGQNIDHRIDLFALGVICFQMLTGRMPFEGDGVTVATANITQPTPKMGIDPLLEAFTHRLMAKDPDERLASAGAARDLIDLIERDRATAAAMLGIRDPGPTPSSEIPVLPVIAVGSAKTVALGTAPTVVVTTNPVARPRNLRGWLGFGALAVLVLAVAIGFAIRRTHGQAPALAPIAAASAEIDEPRTSARTSELAPALSPVAEVAPQVAPAKRAPAASITAESVARHYAAVGRKLKVRGTDEQWRRYREIHINEVMAAPERFASTEAQLKAIERVSP